MTCKEARRGVGVNGRKCGVTERAPAVARPPARAAAGALAQLSLGSKAAHLRALLEHQQLLDLRGQNNAAVVWV